MWVSPFRYPRIIEYLLLPVAFRSLSRLSSALSAKASTLRSFQLNLLRFESGYRMKVIGLASSLAEDDWFQPVAICEAKALIDEVDKITGSYLIRGCFQSLRPQRRTLRSWFLTLASSSFDEVLTRFFSLSSTSFLDVSIFYRFRSEQICSLLYSVFKVHSSFDCFISH